MGAEADAARLVFRFAAACLAAICAPMEPASNAPRDAALSASSKNCPGAQPTFWLSRTISSSVAVGIWHARSNILRNN